MPSTAAPNLGTNFGWSRGEGGWDTGADANWKMFDALVLLSIKDRTLATPPGSPVGGDRYLIAASPTGVWAGQAGKIAVFVGSAWSFFTPKKGWATFVENENRVYVFDNTNWVVIGQKTTPFALTDAATISVDASNSNHFRVTLGGNRTLANPTNLVDGQRIVFVVKQDGTGSRTLSYGSKFKFPGGTAPTLTTAANAIDMLTCYYDATLDLLLTRADLNLS